ncbi:hypothetical protein [Breoghania sp.]|uniref:hypothetical protein n=1 Tax=Breoghania sp. TaxID=2065378 RepID=UPI00262E6820|nr:hypothetical protein [Breoghania sp.]MDJ0930506.1 hypothetical protein [Breoghania sp.]
MTIAAVCHRSDGVLVALAPLGRRPLGLAISAAHVWTHAYAPLGTPLLVPDCAHEAAVKFIRLVTMQTGPMLALPEQRLDGSVAGIIQDAAVSLGFRVGRTSTYLRPVLSAHDTMERFLSEVSSQRRRRIAKGYRRLKGEGHLVRDHLKGAHAAQAFDDFLELEQAGWKGEHNTAIAGNPASCRVCARGDEGAGGLRLPHA